jgi:hypothetical protein
MVVVGQNPLSSVLDSSNNVRLTAYLTDQQIAVS